MHTSQVKYYPVIALVAILVMSFVTIVMSHSVQAAQPSVDLRTASPFAILSGTPNITDAGNASVITGNVGLSPATGAGTMLTCSQVTGTIYSVDAAGPLPCRITNAPLLLTAKNNLTTAYNDVAGRTPLTTLPTELGGRILVAGVYDSSSTTFGITAGAGALVLDGQNDSSSVFIFQAPFSGNGLNVNSGSTVSLINGAQACNVFWRVDSAAIDTTATFVGTILALNSITVANGANIQGRLLARNGSVTLINDTITASVCAGNDSTDTTPGLPDTGEASRKSSILWVTTLVFFASIASLLAYAFYKKRSI
ncbi:MAG: hypothetical protein JWO54_976 [Candidatus Saccharibacteria bacterium]|nr:hypothetical protein [Candidatus Saccharibacteria bacterium]